MHCPRPRKPPKGANFFTLKDNGLRIARESLAVGAPTGQVALSLASSLTTM